MRLLRDDHYSVQELLGRFSIDQRKDLRALESNMPLLVSSLDQLVPYEGLWTDVHLPLHRANNLRCVEVSITSGQEHEVVWSSRAQEFVCYLTRIRLQWSRILCGIDPSLLDCTTVRAIAALTPQLSRHDRDVIKQRMGDGTLFRHIVDAALRARVRSALLSVNGRIVTLATFTEDTLYLEPLVCALRKLMPARSRDSTRMCMRKMYVPRGTPVTDIIVETTKGDVRVQGSDETRFACILVQMWLNAARNFPELTGVAPKKDAKSGGCKTRVQENEVDLYEFAQHAHKLGFVSKQIEALMNQDPFRLMTERLQEKVAPNVDFSISKRHSAFLTRISDSLRELRERTKRRHTVSFSTDDTEQPTGHRSGRPRTLSHMADRNSLFLDCMFLKPGLRKLHATSAAIKVDILRSFLDDVLGQLSEIGLASKLVGGDLESVDFYDDSMGTRGETTAIVELDDPEADVQVSESQYSPVSDYHSWIYGRSAQVTSRDASTAVVSAEAGHTTTSAGSPGLLASQCTSRKRSYRALVGSLDWSTDMDPTNSVGASTTEAAWPEGANKGLPLGWERALDTKTNVLYFFLTNELEMFAPEDPAFERRVRALFTCGQVFCINRDNAVFWATPQDLAREQRVLAFPIPRAGTPSKLCRQDFHQTKCNMRELLEAFESQVQQKRRRKDAMPAIRGVDGFLAMIERTIQVFESIE